MNTQATAPKETGPSDIHAGKPSVFDQEDSLPGRAAAILHNCTALVTIPLMMLFICTEVVMRYVLNSGLTWSQEACGIMLFILVLGCQANCWQKDRHIRMDLLYNAMPPWFRKISDMLTIICGGIFYGTIALQAVREIPYQFTIKEATDEMHIPLWILNGIIILSGAFLVILLIRHALRMMAAKKEHTPWQPSDI